MAISDKIYQIRHAVYGREVRENIAGGIEECYSDVQAGVTSADAAAETANTAASNANTKASAAQTAATNANTAATNANTAAQEVRTALNTYITFSKIGATNDYEMIIRDA